MDETNFNEHNWDDSVYGTGRTQPPKSRGGLIALLLILVIFLCGIITVLGVLNVRLFQELKIQEEADMAISFSARETEPEETEPEETEPEETVPMVLRETAPEEVLTESIQLQQSPAGSDNIPQAEGLSLQEIYVRNIPSVVSITCTLPGGSSTGTGVVLTKDGYLITNAHVVENAVTITVQLTDDRVLEAQILGFDEVSDLAVLQVEASDLVPARFGDSAALRVGDTVVAIGDPLGVEFRGTYTDGIVSAINRDVELEGQTMTLIQTNAALNSGNSGGPLINCFGQVIGINTMKIGTFASASGVEGLGFAIPSVTVKEIADQLIRQGYVSGRPTLGIQGEAQSPVYQHFYHLPAGLYITHVDRGSDAYQKGIEPGDILISIGDRRINTMTDLKAAIGGHAVGDSLYVVIYRAGQQYQLELTLTEDKG